MEIKLQQNERLILFSFMKYASQEITFAVDSSHLPDKYINSSKDGGSKMTDCGSNS